MATTLDTHAEAPSYQPLLDARHKAHEPELRGIIETLPVGAEAEVLDVPCGDGFFARLLGEATGPGVRITGVDVSQALLARARSSLDRSQTERFCFQIGDAQALPFGDDLFDVVFSAHSLISLPDPAAALREMQRVTRPGGLVAVLENDAFHEIILPWPEDLEVSLQAAQRKAHASQEGSKPYVGRRLRELLLAAGLSGVTRRTFAIDRQAPLQSADREFVRLFLESFARRVEPQLDPAARERLEPLVDPQSEQFLADQAEFEMTWLDVLVAGRK